MKFVLRFAICFVLLFAMRGAVCQENRIFKFVSDLQAGFDLHRAGHPFTAATQTSLEYPLLGNRNHDYTFNFPTVGFAVTPFWTRLNSACSVNVPRGDYLAPASSWTVAIYPYFLWPFVHTNRFAANLKVGAGFSFYPTNFFNKQMWREEMPYTILTRYCTAIMNIGLNFDILLGKHYGSNPYQWELTFGADLFELNSFSLNRSAEQKTILTFHIGTKYTPNVWALPIRYPAKKVRHILALEFSASGGISQLEAQDGDRFWPSGTVTAGAYIPITNAYRVGIEADWFYNEIYDGTQREDNRRYNFIDENRIRYKMRSGIGIENDITLYNKFVIGLNCSFYVFNPIPVPKEDDLGRKNEYYKIENLMYQKLTLKFNLTKNFFFIGRVKTHLLNYENVEFGCGYAWWDFGTRLKNPFKRLKNPFKRKEDYTEEKIEGERNKYYLPRDYK